MDQLTRQQRFLLQLLGKSLFGKDCEADPEADWPELLEEARAQTVLPLALDGAVEFLPAVLPESLENERSRMLIHNMNVEYGHTELHRLLQEAGIPYVIMKGSASAAYYPSPMLRMMGDIDVLVEKDREGEAEALLLEKGFHKADVTKEDASYYRSVEGGERQEVELHHSPKGIPERLAGERAAAALADCVETGRLHVSELGEYRVPDDFHHGLILLLHTANHMINTGVGLRHLCDWAVFADRLGPERFCSLFEEPLKSMGLWHFARVLTAICVRWLGCAEQPWAEEGVEEELLEPLCADIFSGGNFGRKDEQRINQAKLMTDKGKGGVDGTGMLRQLVRTMNEKGRLALPAAKRFPVLMPAAWTAASWSYLRRVAKGRSPGIRVKEMVRGASQRRAIYQKLRLFETDE